MRIVVTGVKRYSFRQIIIIGIKRCEPIQLIKFRKFWTILIRLLYEDFSKKKVKKTKNLQFALMFGHWTF